MRRIYTLSELEPGHSAQVSKIDAGDSMHQRFQDLGLIPGTEVLCMQKSPLGDPTAFLIRGAVIALRCEDSDCIQIQPSQV